MPVLLLDTSTDYAIVGVCTTDAEVLASQIQKHERQLSVRLFGMIDAALEQAGIKKSDLDALSIGLGPGSFTGVRVAVTTMRTLAQVLNIPLYSFGTLDAFAQSAIIARPETRGSQILTILPSRKGEVYLQCFQNGKAMDEAVATDYDSARMQFGNLDKTAIVSGPDSIITQLFSDVDPSRLTAVEYPGIQSIALLTSEAMKANLKRDPLSLDPMYIAPPAVSQHKMRN
jgi:tRNA threonylcarbamoyladenosine biosynthesis protein TsaB